MTTPTPTLRRLQRHHHDDIYRHRHDDNQRQRQRSDFANPIRLVGTQRATTQRHADWKVLGENFCLLHAQAATCYTATSPPRPHHNSTSPPHLLHGTQLQEAPGTRRPRPKSAGDKEFDVGCSSNKKQKNTHIFAKCFGRF